MHYFIYTLLVWGTVYLLISRDIHRLWKPALIGVVIMVVIDLLAAKYNLYIYSRGVVYVDIIPLFQIINTYGLSILYLKWLPKQWNRRIMYTIYVSVLFLAVEAVMYQVGAIAYPNWKFFYSYLLNIAGLSLLAFLSDISGLLALKE